MSDGTVSRRRLVGMGLATASATALPLTGVLASPGGDFDNASFKQEERLGPSLRRAYVFLNTMMDAYAQGTQVRLIQSYSDQQGLMSTAFTYDNALAILAYVARGRPEDIARARVIGDGLLYAQQH